MKRRVITRLIVVASLVYVGTTVLLPRTMPTAGTDRSDPGFGSVDTLMASYTEWEADYVANGGDRRLTLSPGVRERSGDEIEHGPWADDPGSPCRHDFGRSRRAS